METEKKFKEEIDKLKKELEAGKKNKDLIAELNKEIDTMKEEFEMKKYENEAMKTQVIKLDKDLALAKKDIKNAKYNDRLFLVDRMKDGLMKNKKPMSMLFRYNNKDKNSPKVEVVLKRSRNGIIREDTLNILDITFKVNEKKKDQFDIYFNVSLIYLFNI